MVLQVAEGFVEMDGDGAAGKRPEGSEPLVGFERRTGDGHMGKEWTVIETIVVRAEKGGELELVGCQTVVGPADMVGNNSWMVGRKQQKLITDALRSWKGR
jgi:hypothetical protein